MSQHIVLSNKGKWVFGWDQPLQSFYLQVHDDQPSKELNNIVLWLGADKDSIMYEVEDLVMEARRTGLTITPEMQTVLYRDKDDGA